MKESDDWRRQGQEEYLTGTKLIYKEYVTYSRKWEHDHCEFCGLKFEANEITSTNGYTTEDEYYWICISASMTSKKNLNLNNRIKSFNTTTSLHPLLETLPLSLTHC